MKTLHIYIRILAAASRVNISRHHLKPRHIRSILGVLFVIVSSISNIGAQANGYFYVGDLWTPYIAVYNGDLVFQHYISTGYSNGSSGLDFLPNGNLVAAGYGSGRHVVVYDPAGTVVSNFSHPNMGFDPFEVKAGASDLIYIAGSTEGIMEFTTSGTFIRSFSTLGNQAVAVLPGNVLWGAGPGLPGTIDVFDLFTGIKTSTIFLDNGQVNATAFSYSASTDTVLMCGGNNVYERTLSGTLVRNFTGGSCEYGVTRGPNGDVYSGGVAYSEDYSYAVFHRWNANGVYLGSTDMGATGYPGNIVWAGYDNPGPPANHEPVLSGIPTSATINEGSAYSFTATATDVDGDSLRFLIGSHGENQGGSIDPLTGVFIWTPSESQGPATYIFYVSVVDDDPLNGLFDQQSITITVNEVNLAPILGAISNQTGSPRNNITFTATATDPDIPTNTLTFSLIGATAGATINPSTGFFSWIPTNKQLGQYTFAVRVSDNGSPTLTDEQTVTVTVSHGRGR